MKNIFIVNPKAGRKRRKEYLLDSINRAKAHTGQECEVYYTKGPRDAEKYIKTVCSENPDRKFRFFGCGGDGTLNEVINGAFGYDNAICGNIPLGTGNDFIRNFGTMKTFEDISAQLLGAPQKIDVIRCTYEEEGQTVTRYCDNMINIGFDSNVVVKTDEIKKTGLVVGPAAYLMGVGVILIKKKGADLRIELDNGYVYDGPLLLTAIANGKYCGGGVKNSPYSEVNDGIIEVSVIKDISRSTFVSLYPSYSKGTHFKKTQAKHILEYNQAKRVRITSNKGNVKISNDGEIIDAQWIELEVLHDAINFSVPYRV